MTTGRITRRRQQLFAVMVVAELVLIITSITWIDAIVALPLVLVIPGLAILGSLENDRPRLPYGDAFVWSVVMSFASAVFGGLLLNITGGLTRHDWLIYTAVVVTLATFVTIRTSPASSPDDDTEVPADAPVRHRSKGSVRHVNFSLHNLGTALIGIVILAASFVLSYQSAAANRERFTQLWLVPAGQRPATAHTVAQLGVQNHQGVTERYSVALYEGTGNAATTSWSVNLGDGGTWTRSLRRPRGTSLRATLTYGSGSGRHVQYVTLESTS